ncbi:hypothetical protein JYG23_14515 [Sedimentibacter sp. zth1]|uniref:hypothetical protein n=1 Tax=Sedimentibacter sp. zth1 TaxID=2816908 RepID=UPI001A918798|nr:hypothetical protein [Sedimentibacter sp. zth1]QSX05855.1 hypothetical protein JYG23_14515 [Sedimentibacter sp. zth1]
MEDLIYYKKYLKILIISGLVLIFLTASNEMFYITFVLIFAFMVIRTLRIKTSVFSKLYILLNYLLLCIAELVYVRQNLILDSKVYFYYLNKLLCTVAIILPFIIEKILTVKKYIYFNLPSLGELSTVSFNELRQYKDRIASSINSIRGISDKLSISNFKDIVTDLPRHSSFKYISNGNLTDEYFDAASKALDDPHLYIIISRTGSAASEFISVFTRKSFNHSSIAFDKDLETIVSYNGGERVYPPGLNYELVEHFIKKDDSSILIYSIDATKEQKKIILNKINEINTEGSAYNILGLLLKQSYKPNIMFCSQFVYKMLEISGLNYFDMESKHVRPTDFIEKDYYRKVKFEYSLFGKKSK